MKCHPGVTCFFPELSNPVEGLKPLHAPLNTKFCKTQSFPRKNKPEDVTNWFQAATTDQEIQPFLSSCVHIQAHNMDGCAVQDTTSKTMGRKYLAASPLLHPA